MLILLVDQRHRTVAKSELIDHCWPGQAVEPNNLAVQIWALRRLLEPQTIATVAGRGYRFVAPVDDDRPPPPPIPRPSALPEALPTLAPMFGRDTELAQLLALLSAHRLVTLLGPHGVGKTRLAQAVVAAHAARGLRALLVDLAAVRTGPAVEYTVRQALGQVDSARATPPVGLWHQLLAGQRLLEGLPQTNGGSEASLTLMTAFGLRDR